MVGQTIFDSELMSVRIADVFLLCEIIEKKLFLSSVDNS